MERRWVLKNQVMFLLLNLDSGSKERYMPAGIYKCIIPSNIIKGDGHDHFIVLASLFKITEFTDIESQPWPLKIQDLSRSVIWGSS